MTYHAPVSDMTFSLNEAADLGRLEGKEGLDAYDPELVLPILEEASKLASEVLAPLNSVGDKEGAKLVSGDVIAAPGFKEAYAAYQQGGWIGLSFPEKWGGQGLPKALALAVMEMIHASNMSFGLCPMLSLGAIEALLAHGTPEQQEKYLPKLVSGEWTGTMNLTEPQAGSDVGALKTKATPQQDGTYRISGQKIYITWGDHDCAENIIHLVLARLPDAPEGSRGVSLFLVPKFMVNEDGSLGERNDLRCIGLEKKMGIHASPTCVMEYGGNGGAVGYLIGQENRGLACMFTMMNSARLNVGLQGVAVGDAAYQEALNYANERKQGKAPTWKGDGPAPIIHHADVRRNLTIMRSRVMAARSICYACAVAADEAVSAETEEQRQAAKLREELLTPVAKAWSTDMGVDVASLGVQIHGGMGFMDETLAAQLYRDARIAPIYEGTNGIQAADLVGRKLAMANGEAMSSMLNEMRDTARSARNTNDPQIVQIAERLEEGIEALDEATSWISGLLTSDRDKALASATPYLELTGDVMGGRYLLKQALGARSLVSQGHTDKATLSQIAVAGFYAESQLRLAKGKSSALIGEAQPMDDGRDALFDLEDA